MMGRGNRHPPILGRRALREDVKALLRKSAQPAGEPGQRGNDGARRRSTLSAPTTSPSAADPDHEDHQEPPANG